MKGVNTDIEINNKQDEEFQHDFRNYDVCIESFGNVASSDVKVAILIQYEEEELPIKLEKQPSILKDKSEELLRKMNFALVGPYLAYRREPDKIISIRKIM